MSTISRVRAREVLDSRGNPTVEVDVVLADGTLGRALAPSGASTGTHEAVELRDAEPARFGGLGVLRAVESIHREIAPAIIGRSPLDQEAIDGLLIDLDGTPDKARLGANAMVAVSMAVAHAAAAGQEAPLYRYLGRDNRLTLPVPMFNILNGGRHADNSTDIQEFMVVPAGLETFRQAVQAGAEVFHSLGRLLKDKGLATNVGDEGGFAPSGVLNQEALELVLDAIELAGYGPGDQCFIALDVAANEFAQADGQYSMSREQQVVSSQELIDTYERWVTAYPVISIEDGMGEDDWTGWREMTRRLGNKTQIVGDDLYTTNPGRIRLGIDCVAPVTRSWSSSTRSGRSPRRWKQ